MATLSALVLSLDAALQRLGYKDLTLAWYRACWRRLGRFFAARGVEEFSLDLAMAWVDEACGGFFQKEQTGTLKPTDVYLFRIAQMLGDYALHGAVLRRYSRSVNKLTGEDADTVARFQAWLQAADLARSTVRVYGMVAGEFVAFMGTRGGLARCDADSIGAFVATLAGYQVKTVEQKLCAVRSFLRFAAVDGLVAVATLDAVPAVPSSKQARIPSVWERGDVARILDAVDRGNPGGKRDYAIILLIARLGLRGVDVRRLEFGDFDWPGNRLSIVQAKTGHRVQLPLLKEVGWAVIDYIRHARPVCDCPQVFLRHTAPIGPFSDDDHLHQILVKHARVAHVRVSEKRRHGMHSLRHTLATRLMEDGTPVEQIADILGHQSIESTGVYLKSSLGLLAKCALDPDASGREASR
jgi:integrase